MKEIRRRSGVFQTVAAFVCGAGLGSILALLYAPASGRVTRQRLILQARSLRRNATRRLGQTGRVIARKAASAGRAATEWIATHVQGNGRTVLRRREVRHAAAR